MKAPPVRSFPAVAGRGARVLVLGSMPGEASLAARQYYAHPLNAFWRLAGDIFGAPRSLPYRARLRLLTSNGVALWDVLASCRRKGSSDSAIRRSSIMVNDIAGFLEKRPGIRKVLFNGAKAEECFRRYVLPGLRCAARLELARLPSTSPAYASMNYAAKLKAWRGALRSGRSRP